MSAIVSAISASAMVGFAVYLCRETIREYIVRGIQHRYDERLAEVQSEFRQTESRLSSQLKLAETKISSLQSSAVSAVSARQAALDSRRFQAVDELWRAVVALGAIKGTLSFVMSFKIDAVMQKSRDSKPLRDMFANFVVPTEKLKPLTDTRLVQPFVSQKAWGLFSAYSATLAYAQAVATVISIGVGDLKPLSDKAVLDSMKAALPGYSEYIDVHGVAGCFRLLDQVEASLVVEIQRWLEDSATDDIAVKRSVEVSQLIAAATSLPIAEPTNGVSHEIPDLARLNTPLPKIN